MMQTIVWAAAGTAFLFLMTSAGAAMVLLLPEETTAGSHRAALGFAAGVMTAAAVWSLLLPSMERGEALGLPCWLPAAVGMLAGTAFLAVLDHRLSGLRWDQEESSGALLAAASTLHNIPEGMAVGLAMALAANGESLAGAAALAMGIGIQNFPEGLAIALPLREGGRTRVQAFCGGVLSGAVEPAAGILAAVLAVQAAVVMPWLLGFAAGAMIYVTVEELIPQAHSRAGTCGFVAGFLLMMVLDVALG